MSLLRRLEDALQSAIEGGLSRLDGGGVHPLEIARRLQSEMLDHRLLGTDVPYVPNRYVVRLSDEALENMGEVAGEVEEQIARHLQQWAQEQGWAWGDEIRVSLEGGGAPGRIETESRFDEDAPGAELVVLAGQSGGARLRIAERATIGRDETCDVQLADPAVSRRHAEMEWTYRGYRLRDLGSRNGTFVNAVEIEDALLYDGDLIEVGLVQLRFIRI